MDPLKAVSWNQLSLDRRQKLIREAFRAQYPAQPTPDGYMDTDLDIYDVYDATLTVRQYTAGKLWQVGYTVGDDGAVTFAPQAEWVEVEMLPIAVKGNFELDILAVPFGGPYNGKDSQGEWFDATTKFHEDKFGLPPLVYYHAYDPDGKPLGEPVYFGRSLKRWVDSMGVWYRGVLDDTIAFSRQVIESVKTGMARASTGSAPHLVRKDPNGHIREWPVVELSLIDVGGKRQPANPYAVAVPAAKALYLQAGLTLPDDIDPAPTQPTGAVAPAQSGDGDAAGQDSATKSNDSAPVEVTDMDPKEIQALIDAALKADREAQAQALKAETEAKAKFDAAVKAQVETETAAMKAELVKSRRLPDGAPYVMRFNELARFDNWSIQDMAFWGAFVPAAKAQGNPLAKPLGADFYKALVIKCLEDNGKTKPGEFAMKAMLNAYHRDSGAPLAALKANEVMQYDLPSYGDEWVPVLYSSNLWYAIRFGTPILDRLAPYMVEVMNAEELKLLLEGTNVAWYKVAEVASLPTTELTGIPNATVPIGQMGSGAQSLTLGKMGARVLVSGELSVSTPLSVVSEVRRNMEVSGRETMENIAINGDTLGTNGNNINDTGGTPDTDEVFLVANGFRKLAITTNSANSRDAGTLGVEDFKETLALMGTGGANAFSDPTKVSFICDVNTWAKALDLAELKTQDVYGAQSTILTGKLPPLYGVETIMSSQMHKVMIDGAVVANSNKADAAGHVDTDTLGNNTKGAILAVRWDQWRMGYRRQMSFETQRIARADVTELVALAEIGMVYRDTEASAISYDITL